MLRSFGSELRSARRMVQENLLALAEAAGVSVAYVSMVERGEKNPPSEEVIKKWVKILKCQHRLNEFLELARTSVKSVHVTTNGKSYTATNVMTALARSYEADELSDDVWKAIYEEIERRTKGDKLK
jgi:transcriptional regulator with XRE-family HTH domain